MVSFFLDNLKLSWFVTYYSIRINLTILPVPEDPIRSTTTALTCHRLPYLNFSCHHRSYSAWSLSNILCSFKNIWSWTGYRNVNISDFVHSGPPCRTIHNFPLRSGPRPVVWSIRLCAAMMRIMGCCGVLFYRRQRRILTDCGVLVWDDAKYQRL